MARSGKSLASLVAELRVKTTNCAHIEAQRITNVGSRDLVFLCARTPDFVWTRM